VEGRTVPDKDADAELLSIYQAYRCQIEHEDNLIGYRINWLLAAESFLFVGYETALTFHNIRTFVGTKGSAHLTIYVLPALGMALAFLAEVAVMAAAGRLNDLREQFKRRTKTADSRLLDRYPSITSHRVHRRFGRLQAHCVAPLFFVAWAALLFVPLVAR